MPPTDNPKINDDVFDADENSVDYDNTCSPTPELDPKRDPAPLQSQGIGKQQRCAHCGNLRHRFPRTFAITFQVFLLSYGVFLPLYSLIALSMVFGYFLCKLEAPGEKHANNMALAAGHKLEQLGRLSDMTLTVFPLICMERYIKHKNGEPQKDPLEEFNDQLTAADGNTVIEALLEKELFINNDTSNYNFAEMRKFIAGCGMKVTNKVEELKDTYSDKTLQNYIGTEVTFNWIKCPVGKNTINDNLGAHLGGLINEVFVMYDPEEQLNFTQERWENSLNETYTEYYASYLHEDSTLTSIDARIKAIDVAYANADGFDLCVEDVMSSAWWAFTLMTTIGYGNVTPATDGGRALVYTVGFISIILFACILAKAGDVITTIVDDTMYKANCPKWSHNPLVLMLFWGALFYSFLCVTAQAAIHWKRERVGVDMNFKDAYWFSFITSTTVGFGDIYFEHEAISGGDVVMFASLVLIAFTLLSSFLDKLSCLFEYIRRKKRDKSEPSLAEILRNTPIFGCSRESLAPSNRSTHI